jgi:hypothetical protein
MFREELTGLVLASSVWQLAACLFWVTILLWATCLVLTVLKAMTQQTSPNDSGWSSWWPIVIPSGIVIVFWFGCLGVALGTNPSFKIEHLGQVGDTFGSVNALFTGVALVGLVYTIYLQLMEKERSEKTIDLQRKEIASQEEEAKENRRVFERQRREQFLTARLAATTALFQANEARALTKGDVYNSYATEESARESRKLKQQLAILRMEARRGFDGEEWNHDSEQHDIVAYIHELLQEHVRRLEYHIKWSSELDKAIYVPQTNLYNPAKSTMQLIRDLVMLKEQYPHQQQLLSDLDRWRDELKEMVAGGDVDNPKKLKETLRNYDCWAESWLKFPNTR